MAEFTATEFQLASTADVMLESPDTDTVDLTMYAVPISLLWTETDADVCANAVDTVAVGADVSIVTVVADDVTDSPSIVATAVIDGVPESVAVVQVHAPVDTVAVHVEPVLTPFARN